MKKLILILTFLSINTFACDSISAPRSMNIAIDPANKTHYFYDDLRLVNDRPHASMQNCLKTAKTNSYLMIAVGLENFVLSDELMTYSINDTLSMSGDSCQIDNNNENITITKKSRNERLLSRRDFLDKCVVYQVTDISESGLEMPIEQPGCSVEFISKYAANFKGSFCFVKPSPDSSISFHLDINPECKSYEFFRNNKVDLQDVLGNITLYTSGDASGQSVDLKTLKQFDLRVSVNAPKDLIPTNEDYGSERPLWPTTWEVDRVSFAAPKISTNLDKYDEVNFPVLVDNNCKKICKDNLCTSNCSFSQPVVGEFLLYDMTKGKKELVASWFDGGVAPANWSGILTGVGTKLQKGILLDGHRYKVVYDLSDQELNYMSLKGRVVKQIKMQSNNIPELRRGGISVGEVPSIGTINEIQKLPLIENIVGIFFSGNGFVGIKNALNSISRTFFSSFWPPYFDIVCNKNNCISQDRNKLSLELDFTLKEENKKLTFTHVNFSRSSNLNNSLRILDYKFPKLNCGFGNSDTPDFGDIDFDF